MDLVEAWSGPIEQERAAPAPSVAETEPIQAFASQTMIRG
jgi:hypothetical protein